MKYRYAFLLGRPGCGKSAVYRELEKQISESGQARTLERADDFPKLWARLQADDALQKEGKERLCSRRSDDGDYHITDDNLFNEILQEVNEDVIAIDKPDHVVFVEFSRPNYIEAFRAFDRRILDNCIVVYIEVSFDTCWARNVARHQAEMDQTGDDHMVGREEMERIFLHDDLDVLVQHMKGQNIPVLVVNNEADGKEHLRKQVSALFEHLLQDL